MSLRGARRRGNPVFALNRKPAVPLDCFVETMSLLAMTEGEGKPESISCPIGINPKTKDSGYIWALFGLVGYVFPISDLGTPIDGVPSCASEGLEHGL
jgi:hypothetical protein